MTEEIKPVCDHPHDSLYRKADRYHMLVCGDCDATLQGILRTVDNADRRPGIPVQVIQAKINTANWQITADMVRRYNAGISRGLQDPCIICGTAFNHCPHDLDETEVVHKMIKAMSKAERYRILNGYTGRLKK